MISSDLVDSETDISFVALAVTPDSKGVLDGTVKPAPASIVHLGAIPAASPAATTYYQVLANIQWRNGSPYRAFQVVFFNLKFFLYTPPAGMGAPVGFFTPL
jgi:hypothetical protein